MSFDPSDSNYREVISRLYLGCREDTLKWLLRKGISEDQALDIYQNAVLAVTERLAQNGLGHFKIGLEAYLFSVTKYLFYNKLKRKENGKYLNVDILSEFEDLANLDEIFIEPDDEIIKLRHKLEKLDEKSNQLLRLFYYEDKSMKEIAEIMGFSGEQVAKTTKYRIIKRLKKMLNAN